MTRYLSGIRGRVTFSVLALSAVLYSALGTVGFLEIAHSGRAATRDRINQVVDQLAAEVRAGTGTVRIATPDGVVAEIAATGQVPSTPTGALAVKRNITLDRTELVLFGSASLAPLTDSLRSLYRVLWIAVPLAALVTAVLAGIATARALRPVTTVTELADSIRTAGTDARVPVPASGDEIEHLVLTLNGMLDRIGKHAAAQRRFTSDAAHELRTPLMALQGEVDLARGLADDGLLDRLAVQAERLRTRVDELVLLATLDESPPLKLQPACLAEVVAAEACGLTIPVEVIGSGPQILVDPLLVGRAVRNLLVNAQRHARAQVRATIGVDEADQISVDVDDDGPGVAPGDRAHVLERFGRLDDARHSDTGGAGLGLSIAVSIANAHGGTIVVGDSPLGGARFTLLLPARRVAESHV